MVAPSILAGASVLVGGAAAVVMDLPLIMVNGYALVDIQSGTPYETYRMLFDTASASSWLYDQDCAEECGNASGYKRVGYNATASGSGRLMGPDAFIKHKPDSAYGLIATDLVKIGPAEWNQTLVAASSSTWGSLPADGCMGLGFTVAADGNASSFIETVMYAEMVNKPRFGLYYGSEPVAVDKAKQTDGVLTLGSSRESKYVDGKMKWVPLQKTDGYQLWQTDVSSISVSPGSKDSARTLPLADAHAVFDTTTAGLGFPPETVSALYKTLGWNWPSIRDGNATPLCKDLNATWSVTLQLNSQVALTLRGDQLKQPGFRKGTCWPPFEATGKGEGLVKVGRLALSQYYSIFDFGAFAKEKYTPRIGFGKLKEKFQPA